MLTGDNGILTKAQSAKSKTAQEEAKERVNLMLAEWKMENAISGVTLNDFLTGSNYQKNRESQGIDNVEQEESKYIATVVVGGTAYEVTINAEDKKNPYIEDVAQAGKRLKVIAEQIGDYTFTGTVEIKVTATAPEGETISSIEIVSGTVNEIESSEGFGTSQVAFKKYTVSSNGTYSFSVTTNNTTKTVDVNIDRILSAPELPEDAISINLNSVTIDVNKIKNANKYPENVNVEYKFLYKLNSETNYTEIDSNVITGLTLAETYEFKVKAYLSEDNYLESETITKQILFEVPEIIISDVKGSSFKITINNNYPEGTKYTYYIGDDTTGVTIDEKEYIKKGLSENTNYKVKVKAEYNGRYTTSETTQSTVAYQEKYIYNYGKIIDNQLGDIVCVKEYGYESPSIVASNSNYSINEDSVKLDAWGSSSNRGCASLSFKNGIDMGEYKYLNFKVTYSCPVLSNTWRTQLRYGLKGNIENKAALGSATEATLTYDLSNFTGVGVPYFATYSASSGVTTSATIYQIWFTY